MQYLPNFILYFSIMLFVNLLAYSIGTTNIVIGSAGGVVFSFVFAVILTAIDSRS